MTPAPQDPGMHRALLPTASPAPDQYNQYTATGKEPAWPCELCRVTLAEAKPTVSKAQFPRGRDTNCGWICHLPARLCRPGLWWLPEQE